MSQQLINDSNDLFSKIWVEVVSAALEGALVDLPSFFFGKKNQKHHRRLQTEEVSPFTFKVRNIYRETN